MFKNQTPLQLAFLAALTIAAGVTLLLGTVNFLGLHVFSRIDLTLIFFLVLAVSLFANFHFVRNYIFRKIKVIYKIIHRQRLPADFRAGKIRMNEPVLDVLDREVEQWAETRGREIESQEQMAAYRRQFIGDVSHELKTPIFNIQGFIHTLLDGAMDDPEVNLKYLQRAARNVDRLQAIVEDLETISKLEAGQLILDIQDFDIHELADEVIVDLEMKAAGRHIRLGYKEGASQHFRVRADKESIRQVLINLIDNSIKYGREGGLTKISFYDLESFILVEVSDNGIGISPQNLPHVFDRFYRADKHRSREVGGTGLGLSIVKHIVEAHKQTINVRSNFGEGSTFGFTLQKA